MALYPNKYFHAWIFYPLFMLSLFRLVGKENNSEISFGGYLSCKERRYWKMAIQYRMW